MNFLNGKITRDNGIWFDGGNVKLKIPSRHIDRLKKYVDREITFGIRPEDICESGDSRNLKEKSEAALIVEVVEPMGNELYLYLSTGQNTIIARLNAQFQSVVGDKIKLVFNMAKAHFFDIEKGDSLFGSTVTYES
jgi:multiple sugar transport system ATP-binding protein